MTTLDQLAANPTVRRVIIYGAPGTGKTWSIGKLADTHKLIYFSLENGHQTLLNPACVAPESRKNITVIQMRDTPENPIACTSLDKFFKDRKGVFCHAHGRINCPICADKSTKQFTGTSVDLDSLDASSILVFDSLTQWAASIGFYLSRDNPDQTNKKGNDSFEYWRLLGLYLDRSLSRIQVIENTSVIVISHESDTSNIEGKEKIVPAGGSRNFARNNARYFDSVIYMYKQNRKIKSASEATHSNVIDTKDRLAFDTSKFEDSRDALAGMFK